MRRILVLLCVIVLAAGCGFRPRGSLDLGDDLGPVRVLASDPFSPLAQDLGNALRRAGVPLAGSRDERAAELRLSGERLRTRPLTVDRSARVREYEVTYRSEEHTSELQSRENLVCPLLLGKKKARAFVAR